MHTVEVPASTSVRSVGSSSTLPAAPGRAEGHQRRRRQLQLLGARRKNSSSLGLAWIAALDPVHAEAVELLGDAQLVVDGERDALELDAVAQGGVEDLDGIGPVGVADGRPAGGRGFGGVTR
jgi:hypothetical protein